MRVVLAGWTKKLQKETSAIRSVALRLADFDPVRADLYLSECTLTAVVEAYQFMMADREGVGFRTE